MQKEYQVLDAFLKRWGPRVVLLGSVILVLLLGAIDYFTGFEISFSFFYLIPISIATLYSDFRNGMIVTGLSVFIWAASNRLAGQTYSSEWILYWKSSIRLVTFSMVAYILHQLNLSIKHQKQLARTDFLTGVHNSREFYRLVEMELRRARAVRQPVSVAYFDIDDFKRVNDRLGQIAGDEILRTVTQAVTSAVRKNDLFARVGGDEFVLFLSGTNEQNIHGVVEKLRNAILNKTSAIQMGVTVSIGVTTFTVPPISVDEIIQAADALMYKVKTDEKGGVLYKAVN